MTAVYIFAGVISLALLILAVRGYGFEIRKDPDAVVIEMRKRGVL